jgi:hypothetical protein
MLPYQDYQKALADGYQIFPDVPQLQYHFTKYGFGREAWSHFDPTKPTSLLYVKTPDGGYKLVGAMYTDRVDATEGLEGSITTNEACEAAGGEFRSHLFGWMVHVYPFETDPKKVWSTDDDDQGHDNMDHSAMQGMKMN